MSSRLYCIALLCPNRGKIPGISYFRLNENRYDVWLEALGLDPDYSPRNKNTYVCSAHFNTEDVIVASRGRYVKFGAVPKLHLGPNIEIRKSLLKAKRAQKPISEDIALDTPSTSKEALSENSDIETDLDISEQISNAEPAFEVIIPFHDCDVDDTASKGSSLGSSTLTCESVDTLCNGNSLFHLLVLIQFCCIVLLQKPMSFFKEVDEPENPRKRKLEPTASGSFSSVDSAGLKGTPKKIRRVAREYHNYSLSPRRLLQQKRSETQEKHKLRKKLFNVKKKVQRLRKKVTNLREVTKELNKKRLISTDALSVLTKSFSGIPLALLQRCLKNIRNIRKGMKQTTSEFPKELRSFAMTLQFYSSKAYDYVRKTFNLALPSPSVIRTWLNRIDCEPGFTSHSFETLKAIVKKNSTKNEDTLCSLVVDEMSIRKQIDFVGQKTWGYVNIGTEVSDDSLDCATEVFVIMVVSMRGRWKLPIGYFLIKSLTGAEKANIIRQCLIKLKEVGVTITSLTCDGPSANFGMAKELGADFSNFEDLKTYFYHPSDRSKIYIIFDPCHMLKLLRNNWAKCGSFFTRSGMNVNFSFIKKLYEIQEQELFRFGNKIRKAHLQWEKQKMKVNLAAQTISRSVADAIETLRSDFKHADFIEAGPTINFIKTFDSLFDVMNSRNPFGRGAKAPLKIQNEENWRTILEEAKSCILQLMNENGQLLLTTRNKTPFLGFLININSYIGMYEDYVKKENAPLKYILTYKTSQDHLELFFLSVRSRNGWNNNPTAFQFYNSYRRLIMNLEVKSMSGNCEVLDNTDILYLSKPIGNNITPLINSIDDLAVIKKYNLDVPESIELEEGLTRFMPDLTELSENVVTYISGFVVRKVKSLIFCEKCKGLLEQDFTTSRDDSNFKLLNQKNRGHLVKPSTDVINTCIAVEKRLRFILQANNNRVPKEPNFFRTLVHQLTNQIIENGKVFNIGDHIFDHSVMENPQIKLIRVIISVYAKIRLYSFAKKQTELIKGDPIRKKLSKIILFSGQ